MKQNKAALFFLRTELRKQIELIGRTDMMVTNLYDLLFLEIKAKLGRELFDYEEI